MRHAVYSEGNGRAVPAAVIEAATEDMKPLAKPPIRVSLVGEPTRNDDRVHFEHVSRGWLAYGECPVCIRRGRT